MNIKVIKRDGSIEDFDETKISKVIAAAGLYPTEANKLATEVSQWVKSLQQSQLTSLQIRSKVLDKLKKSSEYAADLFAWYEKTKEKDSNLGVSTEK